MNRIPAEQDIIPLIDMALREDLGGGDITSNAIFTGKEFSRARIVAKESGVWCGSMIASWVYARIDASVAVRSPRADGDALKSGDEVLSLSGPTKSMLIGERTVLNFLQRMCGIATRTRSVCGLLEGTSIRILDTRKTLPGFRLLDKYAVHAGGGTNHRMGLYDMVMVKDNHIRAAGGIAAAVRRVRDAYGSKYTVEVETATLLEVEEALASGADIIMLDNMDTGTMRDALEIITGRAKTEISGNVDEKRIAELRELKVDYISIGALTHSVRAFDLSMQFL
jgi:nicotinate-nucleotide pyrophosphorylase (carboxylating)